MEGMLVELADYSGELADIISNQEVIISALEGVLDYINFVSQPIWFIAVVIIPLFSIVGFLWFIMKQFIQKY